MRTARVIAASNRARELDPFSLTISAQRGFLLENARRYNEAIEQLASIDPSNPQIQSLRRGLAELTP